MISELLKLINNWFERSIYHHSIIGANAVYMKDILPNKTAAGIPVRII